MTSPHQKEAFKAAQKETSTLLAQLSMAEKMQILNGDNNHPDFKIYSNEDKSLTGVLHKDTVPEGFEPDTQDKSRGR